MSKSWSRNKNQDCLPKPWSRKSGSQQKGFEEFPNENFKRIIATMFRPLKNLRANQENRDEEQSEIKALIQVQQLNSIKRQNWEENKMMPKTQNPVSQTQGFLEVNRTPCRRRVRMPGRADAKCFKTSEQKARDGLVLKLWLLLPVWFPHGGLQPTELQF